MQSESLAGEAGQGRRAAQRWPCLSPAPCRGPPGRPLELGGRMKRTQHIRELPFGKRKLSPAERIGDTELERKKKKLPSKYPFCSKKCVFLSGLHFLFKDVALPGNLLTLGCPRPQSGYLLIVKYSSHPPGGPRPPLGTAPLGPCDPFSVACPSCEGPPLVSVCAQGKAHPSFVHIGGPWCRDQFSTELADVC